MKKRMLKVEEKIAFLEDTTARLGKTIEELNVQVLGLRQEIRDLRRQASPVDGSSQEDEPPPPHY